MLLTALLSFPSTDEVLWSPAGEAEIRRGAGDEFCLEKSYESQESRRSPQAPSFPRRVPYGVLYTEKFSTPSSALLRNSTSSSQLLTSFLFSPNAYLNVSESSSGPMLNGASRCAGTTVLKDHPFILSSHSKTASGSLARMIWMIGRMLGRPKLANLSKSSSSVSLHRNGSHPPHPSGYSGWLRASAIGPGPRSATAAPGMKKFAYKMILRHPFRLFSGVSSGTSENESLA